MRPPRHRGGITWARIVPLLHSYGALVGLMLFVAAAGMAGIGVVRLIFVAGCFGVASLAYRSGGLGLHAEVSIALFVFAPFLRRLVDLHAGYDPSAAMLVGPLVALTAVFPELRGLLSPRLRNLTVFVPFGLIFLCVSYGWAISAFQNSLLGATITATKYLMPMIYCVCLMLRPDQSGHVLRSAARVFLIVSPIISFYGIAQNLNPQAWDRAWMISSNMVSIGTPDPGMVRVYSTMNSPTSFASYAVCGLLLFSFTRTVLPPILVPIVALGPLSVALLLSGVRTEWIAGSVAIAFCLLFNATRRRAAGLILCLAVGVVCTLAFTSFADSVSERISSLGSGVSQDGSGIDRLHDYTYVLTEGRLYLLGVGLAGEGDPLLAAFDGLLLTSVVQMGIVVGTLFTFLILYTGAQALFELRRDKSVLRLVAGAVIIGNMSIFLLLSFAYGEIGFLYWMLVGVLTPQRDLARQTRTVGGRPPPAFQHRSLGRPSVAARYHFDKIRAATREN